MKTASERATHQLLIVEDDSGLRDTLTTFLARAGYRVAAAHDGREALGMLDRVLPDLILTDIHMPDMDGLTLLAEV